jgi:hypothetical protein
MTKINANLSAEVKNAWSSTTTHPIYLHAQRKTILPFSFTREISGSHNTMFIGIICHVLMICVGKYWPEDDHL